MSSTTPTTAPLQNLFGFSEQTWLLIDQWGILFGIAMFAVSAGGAVYAYTSRERIRQWLWRNRFPNPTELGDDHGAWDGLLFTVSRVELPQWVMQCTRGLRFVALLATEHTRAEADALRDLASARGIEVLPMSVVSDPDDPQEARQRCAELLEKLKHAGARDIAVDITGGKKPTSIGAFMAAEEAGATSIYVTAPFANQVPDATQARIKSLSSPRR